MSTILIVDDEEPIRDLLAWLLGDEGHRVLVAAHGRQALDLLEQDPPDLVVSDVMMPILDGAELCRRIKRSPSTRDIPVILMSAAGRRAAGDASADAFIDKPFDLGTMETLIRHWLPPRSSRR